MEQKKYNIEHRKVRQTSMIYAEQKSWITRNNPLKSESEFISHLLTLGIRQHQKEKAGAGNE